MNFLNWLNRNYGKLKEVTVTRGKLHEYLGMMIDFSTAGKVKFRMNDYVQNMLDKFTVQFKSTDTVMIPASNKMFEEGNSKLLGKKIPRLTISSLLNSCSCVNVQDRTYNQQWLCWLQEYKNRIHKTDRVWSSL